jgi:drug/metabolite transporter (DMT)-like permease
MVMAFAGEEIKFTVTTGTVAEIAYLTIFATVITMWVQNRYQGETTPTRAAVIFALEPVVAALLAYAVRDERIGTAGIIGGGIILTGILLSEFSDNIPVLKVNLTEG